MKKVLLLMVVSALLVMPGFAQTPDAGNNTDQASIKGCLGGSDGNYTVTEDGTRQILKITTSSVDLKQHLGQDVSLIGRKTSRAASSGAADNSFAVTGLSVISEHCAATAATPATTGGPSPGMTVIAPAAAAAASTPAASTPAATVSTSSATANAPTADAVIPPATVSPSPETVGTPAVDATVPAVPVSPSAATVSTPTADAALPPAAPVSPSLTTASTPAAAAAVSDPVAPVSPSPETVSTPAVDATVPAARATHPTRPSAHPGRRSATQTAAAAAPAASVIPSSETVIPPAADAPTPAVPASPSSETAGTPAAAATTPATTRKSGSLWLMISLVVLVIALATLAPFLVRWRKRKMLERTGTPNLSLTHEVSSDEASSDHDKPEPRKVA
jgi:hypothetical protein